MVSIPIGVDVEMVDDDGDDLGVAVLAKIDDVPGVMRLWDDTERPDGPYVVFMELHDGMPTVVGMFHMEGFRIELAKRVIENNWFTKGSGLIFRIDPLLIPPESVVAIARYLIWPSAETS